MRRQYWERVGQSLSSRHGQGQRLNTHHFVACSMCSLSDLQINGMRWQTEITIKVHWYSQNTSSSSTMTRCHTMYVLHSRTWRKVIRKPTNIMTCFGNCGQIFITNLM